MVAAARQCFWKVPAYVLDLALSHLNLAREATVYAKLTSLLQALIGPLDDQALLTILSKRLAKKDNCLSELMSSPDLLAELSKTDRAMMEGRGCFWREFLPQTHCKHSQAAKKISRASLKCAGPP